MMRSLISKRIKLSNVPRGVGIELIHDCYFKRRMNQFDSVQRAVKQHQAERCAKGFPC
ncbi:MAG: hypothetical protein JWQ49_4683 [Edaphobacter sp.]|nr:hypothetical protein [Edaphobacter sp.]